MPITLPTNAPFSGAQKMWLKGFLDGINSVLIPIPAESLPATTNGVPVTILWGSQTGNSEALAKKLAKSLAAHGHSPTLRDMAVVSPADLSSFGNVLIITSTYGDGEPPDNAASLHAALHAGDAISMAGLHFAVLALGDSSYPDFCKCGREFHERLAALGATPFVPLVESDVDYDEPFALWSQRIAQSLATA